MDLKVSDERAKEMLLRSMKASGPVLDVSGEHVVDAVPLVIATFYRQGDKWFFVNAVQDIPDLLADRATLLARIAELEAEFGMTKTGFEKT